MTRPSPHRASRVRRSLALSSALGMSLTAIAAPVAAQTVTPFGTVTPNGVSNEGGSQNPVISSSTAAGPPIANTLNVRLRARSTVLDWVSFNVAQNDTANFVNATNTQTVAVLNRITVQGATNTTTLAGRINAVNSATGTAGAGLNGNNGVEVWIANPNGILLSASGNFNTQGFIATTRVFDDIDRGNFLTNGTLTLTAPTGATAVPNSSITGTVGTIVSNGRVQAFIAPVIQIQGGQNGTFDAGSGNVAFVTASDVTIASPGSPLSMTINAGTALDAGGGTGVANSALFVGGTVTAGNAYFIASAQTAINALLQVPASVTTASMSRGVLVLGGRNDVGAVAPFTFGTGGGNTGNVNIRLSGPLTANGGGAVNVVGPGSISSTATLTTVGGGDIDLNNFDTQPGRVVTAAGAVTSSGTYEVNGSQIVLGAMGTTVLQRAVGTVSVRAQNGTLTSLGTLTLAGDTDGTGDIMQLRGQAGIDLMPTGAGNAAATVVSGNITGTAASPIRFETNTAASTFRLGAVRAGQLRQVVGATSAIGISRTGAIVTGNLTLAGANSIVTTDALATGAVSTEGNLTLRGDTGVTVSGAITNLNAGTGNVTISGATGAAAVSLQGATLVGDLIVTAGTGGASFTSLAGIGDKAITSAGGITGATITGAGTVALTAATTQPIRLTGGLGISAGDRLGALTIDGGSAVTMGAAGSTGTTAFLTTANIGRNAAAPVGTLTINGGTNLSGAFAVTTTNAVATDDVVSPGALTIATGMGGARFGELAGAGAKTVTTTGSIAAGQIRGSGAVSLTSGTTGSADTVVGGGIGSAGTPVASLDVNGGAATIGGAYVTGATRLGQNGGLAGLSFVLLDTGSLLSDTIGDSVFGALRARTGAIDVGSNANILFRGQVNGPSALTVQAGAAASVTFGGVVGDVVPFATFTSVGPAVINLNGAALTTTGAQNYGGQLVLGADATLTGTVATFSGGINGAGGGMNRNLALNFSGAQTLVGGDIVGVRNLSTSAAGSTVLSGVVQTVGTQDFNDAVTLAGGTSLISTGVGVNGAIRLANTVNGAQSLTVATPGSVTFGGAVGSATALTTVSTIGAASTALQTTGVTTTGTQTYSTTALNGATDVILNAGVADVSFVGLSGPRGLTVNTSGFTTLPGGGAALAFITTDAAGTTGVSGTLTTAGAQTYRDALSLSGDTTLVGTLATFGSGVTGNGRNLAINTSGAQVLDGTVTGVNDLTTDAAGSLTLNGAIATTGAQRFGEAVTLGSAVSLSGSTITFGGTVDGAQALTTSANETNFNGNVGTGQALASLNVTGAASTGGTGARTIRTTGDQRYSGALALNVDTTLIGSGAIFGGAIDGTAAARNLTLTFSGPTTLTAGSLSSIGDLLVNGAGTTMLGGIISTQGSQTYTSAIVLNADTALVSFGNAAIALNAISGAQSLAINTAGTTTFNAGATGLTSIGTDPGGVTVLNGTVLTTGTQDYADSITLGSPIVIQTGAASPVRFGGPVTGAQDLTLATDGDTIFEGVVTTRTLTSSGLGAVQLNGGGVTTTGLQLYNGQVRLGADTVLTGSTGTFNAGVLGNGFDLTLNFGGTTSLGGSITGFRSLTTGGGGITELSGTIDTTGSLFFGDAVELLGTTNLLSGGGTGTGAITFGSTLSGAQMLTVTTAGQTSFNGAVGATPLASLIVDGTGGVAINGGAITTQGLQRYAGATTLGGNTTLATNGADISFGSTVDGAAQLSVRTATAGTPMAGVVSFAGAVGGATALTGLAIRADALSMTPANRVGTLAVAVNTSGFNFTDGGALTIGTVDGLSGIAAGTGALTLSANGLLTLAANTSAGATTLIATGITQNAGTTVDAGAGAITLDGNDGALTLAGTLTTTNAGADAVRLLDAGTAQLGTVRTGAGGMLTLGAAAGDNLSGTVTQVAGSTLTAGTLTGIVGGAATLGNANAIGVLNGFSSNGLVLRTSSGLAVTGPVNAGTGAVTFQVDGGDLALDSELNAGGTVSLFVAGGITQSGRSGITAPTLTGSAGRSVFLIGPNRVGALGGFQVANGTFTFNNGGGGLVFTQDVSATGPLQISANGIDFTGRTISATGSLTLNGQAGAVTGGALIAGGDIAVSGDTINLGSARTSAAPNGVLTLAAQNGLTLGTGTAGQLINLTSVNGPLSAGTLIAGAAGNTGSVTQITTNSAGATSIGAATSFNGGISIVSGSAIVGNAIATGGALQASTTGGPLQISTGVASTSATLNATGPLTVTTSLTSGDDAQLIATGVVTAAAVRSTGGSVLVRGSSTALADARAAKMLAIEATDGNALLTIGAAGGDASVAASGTATVGTLGTVATPVGGNVTITAKGGDAIVNAAVAAGAATLSASGLAQAGILNGGSVTGSGRTLDIGNTAAVLNLALTSSGGLLRLGTGTAGAGATLSAAGPLTVTTSLTSGGDALLTATGAATVAAVRSTGGSVLVRGSTVAVTDARAAQMLAVEATDGNASLTTGAAGGNADVTASGTATVGTLGTVAAPVGGNLTITAKGGDAIVNTAVAAGAATLSASALAQASILNGGSVTGSGALLNIGNTASGSTLALTASGGSLRLGTGTANGAATLAAGTTLDVMALTAGGLATTMSGGVTTIGTIGGAGVAITGTSATVTQANALAGALTIVGTAGPVALTRGTASGAVSLEAPGALTIGETLIAGGDIALATKQGLTAATVTSTGGAITAQGSSASIARADARTTLAVTATSGDVSLTTGLAGGNTIIGATGAVALGTVSSGGTALVTAGSGDVTGTSLIATGAITAMAGNLLRLGTFNGAGVTGSGRTVEVSNSNAAGNLSLTASAGALTLGAGNATGSATLNATGPLTVATSLTSAGDASATSGAAASIAAITSTAGTVRVSGQDTNVVRANAGQALALNSTGGALTLGTATAGTTATLSATGPLTIATSLTSTGNANATSGAAATVAAITSDAGSVAVSGQSANVTTASAAQALAVTSTGGALTLGTGTATNGAATLTAAGPLTVTTRVTGNGGATAMSTGPATMAAITSGNGAVAVSGASTTVTTATARTGLNLVATGGNLLLTTGTAGGPAILRATGSVGTTSLVTTASDATVTAGTTLNSGTLTTSGAATLTATGAATLGQTTAGGAVAVTAASIGAGQTAAGSTLNLTSPGNVTLAGGSAGGDATFDSGGTVALGRVTAGSGSTIAVRALDVALTGVQSAGTVSFTNRAPTTTTVKLGDGASAGGFALSSTEVNLVETNRLAIDGGTGNVEIGTLAFDGDAGRRQIDVLGTGRIDVNGAVSGTGAGRAVRFGGTAAGSADRASVIRVTATSDAGGRLLFDNADLDLRGDRIGVGQAGGFLDPIGFGTSPGLSAGEVAANFVGNSNSALYNVTLGGGFYAPGTVLVSANSLTVRYTDYALFQNTGLPGTSGGVTLGTLSAGPMPGALVVQGSGGRTVGAFAIFATIGGVPGSSAAVLGPSVVAITGSDLGNTRVNGCLVGSGAGCLTAVVTQPLLAVFDASRVQVFRVGNDLAVPFDPVVGTGNEALFSGLGLIDSGISDTECGPDATNPACGQAEGMSQ